MQEPPAAASQALRPPSGAAGIISGLALSVVACISFDSEEAARSGSADGIAGRNICCKDLGNDVSEKSFLKVEGGYQCDRDKLVF